MTPRSRRHGRKRLETIMPDEGRQIALIENDVKDWLREAAPHAAEIKCEIHTHYHLPDRPKGPASSAPELDALQKEFNERADRWERETGIYSSPTKRFLHEDYQIIMTMGEPVIPMILKRLQTNPSDWFWALKHFARRDVAAGCDNFQDAVDAWLAWGAEKYKL